jgi:hypothetical protein
MVGEVQNCLAVGSLKESPSWRWELKVDRINLFRWYLDGQIETNLRGGTQAQAEAALRRFVERSLKGELEITKTGQN